MDMSVFTAEELEKLKTEFGKAVASTGGSSIRLAEFKQVMGNLGFDHLPLERIFKVFDTNGTGDLDYREFLIGVSKFRLRGPDALKCKCMYIPPPSTPSFFHPYHYRHLISLLRTDSLLRCLR